jgi:hypothetical protein
MNKVQNVEHVRLAEFKQVLRLKDIFRSTTLNSYFVLYLLDSMCIENLVSLENSFLSLYHQHSSPTVVAVLLGLPKDIRQTPPQALHVVKERGNPTAQHRLEANLAPFA